MSTSESAAHHLPRLQSSSQDHYRELFVEHATLFSNA